MENDLLYSQFPFWSDCDSEIDKLLDSINFYKKTWKPKPAPTQKMWHKFDLPFIGVSDEVNLNDSWFDGRLGIYRALDNEWEKEGRIVLFRNNISVVAEQCAIENKLNPDACFIDITKIVLLHEIGHWIFHHVPTATSERNNFYRYFDSELQEAIAQNFVKMGIKDNKGLKIIFKWMCEKQDVIYQNDLPGDLTVDKPEDLIRNIEYDMTGLFVLRDAIEDCYHESTMMYWAEKFQETSIIEEAIQSRKSIKQTIKSINKDAQNSITPDGAIKTTFPINLSQYADFLKKWHGKIYGIINGL